MNVKAVVKVMNFHALLRVEASGRQAVKYNTMEEELSAMMSILQNNQNLRLDKRIHLPDMSLPVLRIYLGSDLGFCGSVNTSVSAVLQHDPADTEKIVIGRKLRRPPNVHVYFTQEEFRNNFELLRGYLEQAVRKTFDLRPTAIIRDLDLRRPIYRQLAAYGHMGREDLGVKWENTDRVDALKAAVAAL